MLICVGIDLSVGNEAVSSRALEVARTAAGAGGRVLLLTVVSKTADAQRAADALKQLSRENEDVSVLVGESPGKALAAFVESFAPHVLVVASSKKGLLERLFVGSCANYVLENAKCNVLLAR